MTTKQEILAYAKQNGFVYPKLKVGFYFGLVGGAVGGFVVILSIALWTLFTSILENPSGTIDYFWDFIYSFLAIPLFLFFSTLFGGIPALLTGIYLSIKEFIVINRKDYGLLFLIGSLSVLFCFIIIAILEIINDPSKLTYNHNDVEITIPFIIIGGISAMICGKLFLPKPPKEFEK